PGAAVRGQRQCRTRLRRGLTDRRRGALAGAGAAARPDPPGCGTAARRGGQSGRAGSHGVPARRSGRGDAPRCRLWRGRRPLMADLSQIWPPVLLTLQLAGLTTLILVLLGTPIAWWLVHSQWKWKEGVAAIVALPLVLPPTVLGFYLLLV